MSKTHSGQNPSRWPCQKIRKATFGRFHRQDPSLSTKTPNDVLYTQPDLALQQPILSKEIPIEYVAPPEVKAVKNFVRFSSANVKKTGNGSSKELVDHNGFSESKFDSFIGRMRMKMSAPSDVGAAKTVLKHDSFDDKVSSFIDRAKLKLRATSSMGANGKPVSFK